MVLLVQMPRGVPVATVAIGNAANAGLLAVRILAVSQPQLLEHMLRYQVTCPLFCPSFPLSARAIAIIDSGHIFRFVCEPRTGDCLLQIVFEGVITSCMSLSLLVVVPACTHAWLSTHMRTFKNIEF